MADLAGSEYFDITHFMNQAIDHGIVTISKENRTNPMYIPII